MAKASFLNEPQQRLLGAALTHFQSGSQRFTEAEGGVLQFEFDTGNGRRRCETDTSGGETQRHQMKIDALVHRQDPDPCTVWLKRTNEGAEIIKIEIKRWSVPGKLVFVKPGHSTPPQPPSARRFSAELPQSAQSVEAGAPVSQARHGSPPLEPADMHKICDRQYGHEALQAFEENYAYLTAYGFSNRQLVQVARSARDGPALDFMSMKLDELQRLFTNEEIAAIAAGGCKPALETVLTLFHALTNKGEEGKKIGRKDIVAVAAKSGGANALEQLNAHFDTLRSCEFTHEQIIAIAVSRNAAGKLSNLGNVEFLRPMQKAGFSHVQITQIAVKSQIQALASVSAHCKKLLKLGFDHDGIIKIAKQVWGDGTIKELVSSAEALKNKGLSIGRITEFASRPKAVYMLKTLRDTKWEEKLSPEHLRGMFLPCEYPKERMQWIMDQLQNGQSPEVLVAHLQNRKRNSSKNNSGAGPSSAAKRSRTGKSRKA